MGNEPCIETEHVHVGICARAGYKIGYAQALADIEALVPAAPERCHCGLSVAYGYDGDPAHHRGMCAHCDMVRCDAHPGECER